MRKVSLGSINVMGYVANVYLFDDTTESGYSSSADTRSLVINLNAASNPEVMVNHLVHEVIELVDNFLELSLEHKQITALASAIAPLVYKGSFEVLLNRFIDFKNKMNGVWEHGTEESDKTP